MELNSIEKLLESILQEISLLTVQTKVTAIKQFNEDYLSTDVRKKPMRNLMAKKH